MRFASFVSDRLCAVVSVAMLLLATSAVAGSGKPGYDVARWSPLHFKPAIEKASDADCLKCHAEVLAPSVRAKSPAGLPASWTTAWYQTLDTYTGQQDTFHRRHLVSEFSKQVMNLRCNTCHQGHDPRDEAPGTSATAQKSGYTLRKQVDPKTCLMCHGEFNTAVMGLPSHWRESGEMFGNNCLICHASTRTQRHNVNFLKPKEIEAAGQANGDACYGCHGGRSWYRISYPYPRHDWEGMDKEIPDWAQGRPRQSESRFLPETRAGSAVDARRDAKE